MSKSIVINGKQYKSISKAIEDKELNIHNLNPTTIYFRIKKGQSLESTFNTPQDYGNSRGQKITVNGKTYNSIGEAVRDKELNVHKLHKHVVFSRMKLGWEISEIFRTPVNTVNKSFKAITIKGVHYKSILDATRDKNLNIYELSDDTVRNRIASGWNIEQAFKQPSRSKGPRNYSKKQVKIGDRAYESIANASKDLGISYGVLVRATKNDKGIEDYIENKVTDYGVSVWGKRYKSVSEVASSFGISIALLKRQLYEGKNIGDAVLYSMELGVTFNNVKYRSLSELCSAYGLQTLTFGARLRRGWDMESALSTPIMESKRNSRIKFRGKEYKSYLEIAREYNVNYTHVNDTYIKYFKPVKLSVLDSYEVYIKIRDILPFQSGSILGRLPYCVVNDKIYNTIKDLCKDLGINEVGFAELKARYKKEKGIEDVIQLLNVYKSKSNITNISEIDTKRSIDVRKYFRDLVEQILTTNNTKLD